jgi:hypothetical protein
MSKILRPSTVEKLQSHDTPYLVIASLWKIAALELGILPMMTKVQYRNPHCYSLSEVAASDLGLLPAMTVEGNGIHITREDCGCLVLTYSFKCIGSYQTRERLEELAKQVLKQRLVDNEFLINNGFKREYGARARRKPVPISPPSPPVC